MEETKTLQEEYSPTDAKREKVRRVAVAMIDDFPEHPFKVKDDEEMEKLKDSISLYGVLTPVVARRCENGRYELISGHRRKYACKVLGIEFMLAIVREMSREEAVIAMVDSNLQREHILPSEKAFAYKMRLEAIKCQRKRNDLTRDFLQPLFAFRERSSRALAVSQGGDAVAVPLEDTAEIIRIGETEHFRNFVNRQLRTFQQIFCTADAIMIQIPDR